jgi:hypothetical protein
MRPGLFRRTPASAVLEPHWNQVLNAPLDSDTDLQVGPIMAAKLDLQRREQALDILRRDPGLAAELCIGRPDLPRSFDDGQLVDANHVPASWLTTVPGIDKSLAAKIVAVRDKVGGFSSMADLELTLNLAPDIVRSIGDRLIFVPKQ